MLEKDGGVRRWRRGEKPRPSRNGAEELVFELGMEWPARFLDKPVKSTKTKKEQNKKSKVKKKSKSK